VGAHIKEMICMWQVRFEKKTLFFAYFFNPLIFASFSGAF